MKNILGFLDLTIDKIHESTDGKAIKVIAHASRKPTCCIKCGIVGTPFSHGNVVRMVKDLPISGKFVIIELRAKRYKCVDCGQTFIEDFPFVDDRNRMTTRMRNEIARRVLQGDTFSRIGIDFCVSDKTVRRIFDEYSYKHLYKLQYVAPRVLGLDEAHIDKHFRLIVTDTENNKLLDMLPDNKLPNIVKFLRGFSNPNDVQVVTMDFAPEYAKAVRMSLPFAQVVIDKFHVIQLLNRKMDAVRKQIHNEAKKQGQDMRRLKHERTLFMTNIEDLTSDASVRLSEWMKEYPKLEEVYMLKEQFREIYTLPLRSQAEEAFDAWCDSVPDDIPEFVSLRKTFRQRREHILNYFDYRYTNAYTESINNRIKSLKKNGMGYRFEVLRMRALFYAQEETMETYDFKQAEFVQSQVFDDNDLGLPHIALPDAFGIVDLTPPITAGIDIELLAIKLAKPYVKSSQAFGRAVRFQP